MNPQPTGVARPINLRIADDLRIRIERGDLAPGDTLPTLQEIAEEWECSINSARGAIDLLKRQGLITGGRGKPPSVRQRAPRVCRSSERHQDEKDLVLKPESVRRSVGLAETDMGSKLEELSFAAEYETVNPSPKLAQDLGIARDSQVLQRVYEMRDKKTGRRLSWSVSYIPADIIESNPALFDKANEPWPGGTQHQLYTVGVEIVRVVDQVSATMPTTVDSHEWGLDDGVPMIHVRRISYDEAGRIVELSDADFPADRTELSFTTLLKKW
ncbi:GntR family transcriptional regulator [Actinoplanes sp. CA-030573]|uniref:GntR family transcriptional regulator n=1 Tax=Actinoplanes sp. CA-030573 TaxID=3239898 RepID=UPI003D8FE09E